MTTDLIKTKICSRCKKKKDVGEFYKNKYSKDGLRSLCIKCQKKYFRKYYQNNKEKFKEYDRKHPYRIWASTTLRQHRKVGCEINISLDELTQLAERTVNCEICDVKLSWERRQKKNYRGSSPTLDRTDNDKLLNKSNVQILCRRCNATKQDRTMKEFIEYCKRVVNKYE